MEIEARSRHDQKGYVDPGVDCSKDEVLTKQSFKDECDINNILKKYEMTGRLPVSGNPVYGDFSDVKDYQSAMEIVLRAEEQFYSLDAQVRLKFQNDPAQFLAFATNEKNLEEMRSMGLAKPASVVASESTPQVSDVSSTEAAK